MCRPGADLLLQLGKKNVKAQDTRARYDDLKRLTTGASEGMNTPAQ